MTRGRLLAVILAVWLLVLGLMLQPRRHAPPRITHARLLEHPVGDLPTLTPLPPTP